MNLTTLPMSYFFFKKHEKIELSKHFNSSEFICHCKHSECQDQMISKELINRLEKIREEIGQPLRITSAFRCAQYQADLRKTGILTAKGKSTHELGDAADISCPVPIDDLLKISAKQFSSIGIAKNFLHCDLRPGHRRWNY